MRINAACDRFDALTYPLTAAELADQLGDLSVELSDGVETIAEVLSRVDAGPLLDPDDARLTFLSGLGVGAIGRQGYSDRDPPRGLGEGPAALSF